MRTRVFFDNLLGMVFILSLCLGFTEGILLFFVGPPITACFCPMYPNPCHCPQPIPRGLSSSVPWLAQAYVPLVVALVSSNVLVALAGIYLRRRAPAIVGVNLVYTLKLFPVLSLVVLEVMTYIMFLYPLPFA